MAVANNAGKKFHATGGGRHITTDNMWIKMERTWRDGHVEEKEKEKESWLKMNKRGDAAFLILNCLDNQLGRNVDALKGNNLTMLLHWKGVKTSNMGNNVAEKKHSTSKLLRRTVGMLIWLVYEWMLMRRSSRSLRMGQSRCTATRLR